MKVLLISNNTVTDALETPLPLGLACVAAATEVSKHEVRLLELAGETTWGAGVQNAISQLQPDVIGISVRNIDDQNMQCVRFLLASLRTIVEECRRASRACIVLGGAGYSIFPESALTFLGADIGIQGEGEVAFPALLSWLEEGRKTAAPPGVHLPNRAAMTRSYVRDLDALPLPEARLWLDSVADAETRIPVQTRRGCPLDCIFCSTSTIEGRAVRKRSPGSVVAWMTQVHQCGFRNFHFVDNTFNLPPSYAKDLCRKLIEAGLNLDWWAIVYPKWLDRELSQLMAKAGCTQVSLGFESGSEAVLQGFNKRFNCAEVQIISEMLADVGIKRIGFLLLGGPRETRDTVEESLEFAGSLCLDSLKITVGIRIYPHTPLAALAVAEGVVGPDDDLLYPRFYLNASLRDWLPAPEITYEDATAVRKDLIMATGRSDYPNQVNNVLGFPFIFRGALDVRATAINEEMKIAATKALADLAKEEVPASVCRAYGVEQLKFGPDYIIPKPFDPCVLVWEAAAVAQAAMDSGVAREPLDIKKYREELERRAQKLAARGPVLPEAVGAAAD